MSIRTGGGLSFNPPKGYTGALQYAWIGDSLISGTGATGSNNSVVGFFSREEWRTSFFLDNNIVSTGNLKRGVLGETTTDIENRFNRDAIAWNPNVAIIANGGVNDILAADLESTFLANWTSVLDQSDAAGIKLYVLLITPWTDADTDTSNTRDTWNDDLKSLVDTYQNAEYIDLSNALGVFRAGGPAGNKWNINPLYDNDGLHLNNAGYKKMAETIFTAING